MKNKVMALLLVAAVLAIGSAAFAETGQVNVKAINRPLKKSPIQSLSSRQIPNRG